MRSVGRVRVTGRSRPQRSFMDVVEDVQRVGVMEEDPEIGGDGGR